MVFVFMWQSVEASLVTVNLEEFYLATFKMYFVCGAGQIFQYQIERKLISSEVHIVKCLA